MSDFTNFTIGEGTGNPLEVTNFEDGNVMLQDGEGAMILISLDQLTELITKLKGE